MANQIKYFKSAFPRSDIAAVLPEGLKVSMAYMDQDTGEYIREVIGDETLIEPFRAAINGVEVKKPARLVNPVAFLMLWPAVARIQLRESDDPLVVDFLRLIDDPRLTSVDRNKSHLLELIDYCAAAVKLTPEQIARVKTGV